MEVNNVTFVRLICEIIKSSMSGSDCTFCFFVWGICNILWIMHELPWITIFESRVRRFVNHFKIIGKSHHGWPQNRYSRKRMYFISYTLVDVLTHNSAKKNVDLSFRHCRLGQTFLTVLWRHHGWFVMSRECRTLALWRHIRRLFLRKLAQRRPSLVNNSREYRFLTTRHSRLSM